MNLDPATLLFLTVLVVCLTAGSCLLTWLQNRQEHALLWMAVSSTLGCLGLITRGTLPFVPAILVGNVLMFFAFTFMWTGVRALGDRPPLKIWITLPSLLWILMCLSPGFRADLATRIVIGCTMGGVFVALSLWEVVNLHKESRIARWWLAAVFGLQIFVTGDRVLYSALHARSRDLSYLSVRGLPVLMIDFLVFVVLMSFGTVALVKERSDQRHRAEARTDPLTGAGSRQHFEHCLREQWDLAARLGQHLSLVMIDADQFKSYNDLYGHPAGDDCLRRLAAVLIAACGEGDVVARYGGEEFAAILPGQDEESACQVAERIRRHVRRLRLEHAGRPEGLMTVSLGIASAASLPAGGNADDLLMAADLALYAAKNQGRDRCVRGSQLIAV